MAFPVRVPEPRLLEASEARFTFNQGNLMLIGILGAAALIGFITGAHINGPHPVLARQWAHPPSLCVEEGVPEKARFASIAAWEDLQATGIPIASWQIGHCTYADIVVGTLTDNVVPGLDGKELAGHVEPAGAQERIFVDPLITKVGALHEELHAIGFEKHVRLSGHALNADVAYQGTSLAGVREAFDATPR